MSGTGPPAAGTPVPAPPGAGRTSWLRVLVAVAAGFAVAFQMGKVPAAIPALMRDLDIGLLGAGAVVSVFSLLTAATGLLMGQLAGRFGYFRCGVTALLVAALAGLGGAFSTGLPALLATRVLEGLGFILAVVALPPLIVAAAAARDRPLVLGIWGAFVPGGMAIMLVLSPPLLAALGWRGLWVSSTVLILAACAVLAIVFRANASTPPQSSPAPSGGVLHRGPLLLAGSFAAYSAQFVALTSFLPTLLIDRDGFGVTPAAHLSALVMVANALGNVLAGWLLRRGLGRRRLLIGAHLVMALSALTIYSDPGTGARVSTALVFALSGGLLPGAMFASAPEYTPEPARLSAALGLLIQGAGIGQTLGPVCISALVTFAGTWHAGGLFAVAAGALGIACVAALPARASPR